MPTAGVAKEPVAVLSSSLQATTSSSQVVEEDNDIEMRQADAAASAEKARLDGVKVCMQSQFFGGM